ncbi:MAG: hypothetical protein PHV61_04920 [Limnochordia bacterium]|nr:hypothetical protein [Limnochordia bacterium]
MDVDERREDRRMAWLKFEFDQGRITIQTDDVVVYETDDAPFVWSVALPLVVYGRSMVIRSLLIW